MKTFLLLVVVASVVATGIAVPVDQQDIETENDRLSDVADEFDSNSADRYAKVQRLFFKINATLLNVASTTAVIQI